MSRHFYIISFAMMIIVFGSGQRGCIGDIVYDQVSNVFDNSGCLAECVGDCGSCEECTSECAACDDCMSECGCDGCAITRIPGTYAADSISNAIQVRLSSRGISFLEDMLAPKLGPTLNPILGAIIEEPVADERICVGYNYRIRICDVNGRDAKGCGLNLNIPEGGVSVETRVRPGSTPDELVLRINMHLKPVTVRNNGNVEDGWLSRERRGGGLGCDLALWGDWHNCTIDVDLAQNSAQGVTFEARFSLGTSGVAPRADANTIQLLDVDLIGLDADISGCDAGGLAGLIPSGLRQQIINGVTDAIMDRVPQLISTALCENRNHLVGADGTIGACPPATSPFEYSYGIVQLGTVPGCGQNNNACLPMLLGMEGRLDARALLNSLAPGFSAVVDFIVAAAGGATTPNDGLSVWLKGGLASSTGHSNCVPELAPEEIPPATDVPRAAVFQGNAHPTVGGEPPSVMLGVSEQFVNRAAYELWSSGALCLQIGSSTLPMLDPGLVGILFGADLGNLVFPAADSDSPLGVGLRPQKPPTIRFDNTDDGGGVVVGVEMSEVQLDFYAWSLDRYVRFVTFELDLEIGVAVTVNNGAIAVDLLGLDIPRAVALNDSLLRSGAGAAGLISNVVGGLIPSFLGGTGPLFELDVVGLVDSVVEDIDLPGEIGLPLSVELRDGALTAVYTSASGATIPARSDDGHAFLGVFVHFAAPNAGRGGSGLTAAVDTQVDITSVYIPEDKSAFAAETFGEGELPRVEFVMSASAPAGVPVEYRYRLGLGGWSDWQDSPYGVIESPLLLLQQDHTVFARARVKGERRTEDLSSAQARFSTDVTAPLVDITAESKGLRVQAFDFHTRASKLEYRYREPEGEFSEWAAFGAEATALIDGSRDVEIEVRDEAGNIASNVAELRGLPPSSAAAGGCSCSAAGPMAGSSSTSMLGFFAMVAMVGGMMYRLRRREEEV